MNHSIFRYNLSKPYPFPWFTYLVVIGGLVLAVFFSVLNFAANAYELKVTYTMNPNKTLERRDWFLKRPFDLLGKVERSCTAREMFLGFTFYTDKLGLPYSLDKVLRLGDDDQEAEILPSLSYMNNVLEECRIYNMQVELLAEDRTAAQFGYAQWGPKIAASISCIVTTDSGRMRVNFSTEYDLLPPTIEDGQQTTLLQRNPKGYASLWWGESLISAYWIQLAVALQDARPSTTYDGSDDSPRIRKGSINLTPSGIGELSSLDFFKAHYHFIFQSGQGDNSAPIWADDAQLQSSILKFLDDATPRGNLAPIWDPIDKFGKSFYSTVLADVGQNQGPNILLPSEESLLLRWTEIFDYLRPGNISLNANMGPATASYAKLRNSNDIGNLSIHNATIHSQYLCQVPHRRQWGHLIVAILVADLVFLRLAWTCTNLMTTWYLERQDSSAMCCDREVQISQQIPGEVDNPIPLQALFHSDALKLRGQV